jgi:hypothetical protein
MGTGTVQSREAIALRYGPVQEHALSLSLSIRGKQSRTRLYVRSNEDPLDDMGPQSQLETSVAARAPVQWMDGRIRHPAFPSEKDPGRDGGWLARARESMGQTNAVRSDGSLLPPLDRQSLPSRTRSYGEGGPPLCIFAKKHHRMTGQDKTAGTKRLILSRTCIVPISAS